MSLREGQLLDNRYELLRELGSGGMGSVWEALDHETGHKRAVKLLHERLLSRRGVPERFLREAQAAFEAKFSGHIVEVFDVVSKEGALPYIVMEYLEGEDLYQIIKREGALDPRRAVDLIIQACNGLDEVHRRGLVHRDIKPGNLFVTQLADGEEWVKLLDFGLVKLAAALQSTQKQITDFGDAIGTIQYMAPEQVTRPSEVDHRADVFALGAVLYEMLAGARPFDEKKLGLKGVFEKRRPTQLRKYRPDLDSGLIRVVSKAMAVNPKRRWKSMFDFIEALEPYRTMSPATESEIDSEESTFEEVFQPSELRELIKSYQEEGPPSRPSVTPADGGQRMMPVIVLGTLLGIVLLSGGFVALFSSDDEGIEDSHESAPPMVGSISTQEPPRKAPVKQAISKISPDAEPEKLTFRWIRKHLGRELNVVMDELESAVVKCLVKGESEPGSKVLVHYWIEGDGAIRFRKTRPTQPEPVRECLDEAAKTKQFKATALPRFVATHSYRVPE